MAIAWLVKAITTHRLGLDAERFKEGLQRSADAFRSELSVDSHRRNTVFSRLHEHRAEVIAELYAAIADAEIATRNYLVPFGASEPPEGKTPSDMVIEPLRALMRSADAHRIWFTPETCERIDGVVSKLRYAYNTAAIGGHAAQRRASEQTDKMLLDAWAAVSEMVPALRQALEADFRSLLGVEIESETQATAPVPTVDVR